MFPTSLQVERWAPTCLAVGAAAAWCAFDVKIPASQGAIFLAALIYASAASAGLLTTALSILLPLAATPTGSLLRQSGYHRDLFGYLRSAIRSCMALCAIAVWSFFLLRIGEPLPDLASTALVFTVAFAATSLVRVAEILLSLFQRSSQANQAAGKDG